jgi:hypothetical protein
MNTTRKTLRKAAFEYSESKYLYDLERSKANKYIIFGNLKLKFLKWLEVSNAHNSEFKWETEDHSAEHWEQLAWQEAIMMFIEDLRSDDFHVDIVGNTKNYSITVALWDKNERNQNLVNFKKIMKEKNNIPYEIRKEVDLLFRALFNLHEKDSCHDHPKYDDFKSQTRTLYKKDMTVKKLKSLILKGSKKNGYKSIMFNLLGEK